MLVLPCRQLTTLTSLRMWALADPVTNGRIDCRALAPLAKLPSLQRFAFIDPAISVGGLEAARTERLGGHDGDTRCNSCCLHLQHVATARVVSVLLSLLMPAAPPLPIAVHAAFVQDEALSTKMAQGMVHITALSALSRVTELDFGAWWLPHDNCRLLLHSLRGDQRLGALQWLQESHDAQVGAGPAGEGEARHRE